MSLWWNWHLIWDRGAQLGAALWWGVIWQNEWEPLISSFSSPPHFVILSQVFDKRSSPAQKLLRELSRSYFPRWLENIPRKNLSVLEWVCESFQTNLRRLSAPLGVKRLQPRGRGCGHLQSILHPQTSAHWWGNKPWGEENKEELTQMSTQHKQSWGQRLIV